MAVRYRSGLRRYSSLGNLDTDPQLEVVTTANDGRVHVYEHDGTKKWDTCAMWPGEAQFECAVGKRYLGIVAPASIADVDNDGKQEVVAFIHTHLFVLDGESGNIERTSNPIADFGYAPKSQPTVISHDNEAMILVQYLKEGGAKWMDPWLRSVYVDLLGRNADNSGLTSWKGRLASDLGKGSSTAHVVSSFFSSDEYFASVGGTNPLFVDALYAGVLGRSAETTGKTFWVGRLDSGEPRGSLSRLVCNSYESGGRRVDSLYAKLLNRRADAGGETIGPTTSLPAMR